MKTVKLSISDLNGCSSSSEKEVNVLLQPKADFEVGSSIGEDGEVSFTNKLSVVADGVYFVQVRNGDYFATKRITVSK
jgi:hypothetical protein